MTPEKKNTDALEVHTCSSTALWVLHCDFVIDQNSVLRSLAAVGPGLMLHSRCECQQPHQEQYGALLLVVSTNKSEVIMFWALNLLFSTAEQVQTALYSPVPGKSL